MKLAPVLLGAISAQSGDDADRWDNTDFSLTDNIFTYEAPKEQRFDNDGCSTKLVIQAVTCWESNHMGNLDHYITTNDDNFGWKNIHHGHDQGAHGGITGAHGTSGVAATQAGYHAGLGQGTQESVKYGKRVPSSSPNYQIGTYSRGMKTHGVGDAKNMIDYHSAMAFDNRYSGCIYEAAGWDYTASTYNQIWRMSYGYDPQRVLDTGDTGKYLNDASGIDRSNTVPIRPNWWHYFNSHILNVGQFDNQFDSYERHLLVMANPAYEGLGYLNWITTFAKYSNNNESTGSSSDDRGAWGGTINPNSNTGFPKTGFPIASLNASSTDAASSTSTGGMNAAATSAYYDEGRFRGQINHNTHDTVTDLYSGGYAFHLGMGCTQTNNGASAIANMTTYDGLTHKHGIAAGDDHEMNPDVNTPTRPDETSMHANGKNYDTYKSAGQTTDAKAEIDEWYSFLISPGNATISDPSLNAIAEDGKTFYPWMSMAAVSSFPHNDLGQA